MAAPATLIDPAIAEYRRVRAYSEALCKPLEIEDYGIQAAPFASPTKWHLAHTTWFFETFILKPFLPRYQVFDEHYEHLFNSYYQGIGEPFARPNRGWLSRPTVAQVFDYRAHVDLAMVDLLNQPPSAHPTILSDRLQLGLNHEQQHQELLLMDLKYNWSKNPLFPIYGDRPLDPQQDPGPTQFIPFEGGLTRIGYDGDGFCFDNEQPRHRVFLEPYALADRLVTNAEFAAFIHDGGYQRADLWLSDGWDGVVNGQWRQPEYWLQRDKTWFEFSLAGLAPLDPHAPVCHVNYYEADAYARWAGKRLPDEREWEHAATTSSPHQDEPTQRFHPCAAKPSQPGLKQIFGDLWEWTSSGYEAYPGFTTAPGAIGEYNGKFMCNQKVLRGGCCVTPTGHARPTYRNFFYADQRWQFCGIRLAES